MLGLWRTKRVWGELRADTQARKNNGHKIKSKSSKEKQQQACVRRKDVKSTCGNSFGGPEKTYGGQLKVMITDNEEGKS